MFTVYIIIVNNITIIFKSVYMYKPLLVMLDSGAGEATTNGDCGWLPSSVAC